MEKNYEPRPLAELGDLIGQAVLIVCEHGAFEGGLKDISEEDIHIEVGEGQVIAVDRAVLDEDLTELYVVEV
ncbi:hypothetical protein BXO87_01910 [Bacillus sp. GZB]|uniref:hypothetical protein n=1 Tax=Bacillus TaxID=1386 RepID=UPI0009785EEA|nr:MULTISPECIES: hypothetical protein [Bacillus]MCZ4246882.1 hypothetical protein [Bacillus amyloliquefaciens]OMQ06785.1 hypothetical protein BXO87_01910 [Bacillus sp. GZB]